MGVEPTAWVFKYYDFPEPHLKFYHLHFFGELMDYFDSTFSLTNEKAATHLAFPELAPDAAGDAGHLVN